MRADGWRRSAALAAGLCLLACFVGLGRTIVGTDVVIRSGLNDFSAGELMRLLGWVVLVVPGAALVGWALAPAVGPRLAQAAARVDAMDARERAVGLALLWVLGLVAARLGRALLLLDRPITDDEASVRFGAQVLLAGRCMVPSPGPPSVFPQLFLFVRHGMITSFDFLGPQLVWAAELGAGLNGLLFAALGALPLPAVAYAVARRRTPAWGLGAALLFAASPMGALFSITSHAHTFSRGLLALGVALAVRASDGASVGRWALAGLALGAAGLCRPVEVLMLSLPLALLAALRAARGAREDRAALLGLCLGALPMFALFALHNRCVTGHALLHARFAPSEAANNWTRPGTTYLQNFGGNLSYNLLLLAVWFLGPLGLPLAALGARHSAALRGAALGVALALSLAVLHPDPGIHLIGPIHYADSAVPLTLLAVAGIARLYDSRYARLVDRRRAVAVFAVTVGVASAVLVAFTGVTLHRHAYQEAQLADELAPPAAGRAVVIVPPKSALFQWVEPLRDVGSHERSWPPADPLLRDRVLLLVDPPPCDPPCQRPDVEALARRRFPDRRLLRMELIPHKPWWRLVEPAPPAPTP